LDSADNRELEGRWHLWLTATYYDNFPVVLILPVDSAQKSWRVHGGAEYDAMTWYSDDYGRYAEFMWKAIK